VEQKPFQKTGTEFLLDKKRAILGDDPGLGKSNQLILAAQGRTLIVCPAMLQKVWIDEIEKWRPNLDAQIVTYSSLCKRAPDSRGRMTKVTSMPRDDLNRSWDTILADEAHYLKTRDTKWTRALRRLSEKCDRIYLATGTPVPNWAHEIYMLLLLTHPGDSRFTNYRRWLLQWFDTWNPPWGGMKIQGLKKRYTWEQFALGNDLHECFLRRTREEAMPDLPALTEQTLEVDMTPAQKKFYRDLKRNYIAFTETGQQVSAWSDGGLHTKLAQASTGPEVLDPAAPIGGKLKALGQLFEDRGHIPLVVFTSFRETARQVAKVGHDVGRRCGVVHGGLGLADRNQTIEMFKTGQYDTLVGTLGTISEGLTLTEADTCIFVERSWRPSNNEQAMRRLHRIGQTRPVTVIHLVTRDSIDERMLAVLDKKDDQAVKMLSAAEFARLL
jgi:SNF2 family DNA or RNA helicase